MDSYTSHKSTCARSEHSEGKAKHKLRRSIGTAAAGTQTDPDSFQSVASGQRVTKQRDRTPASARMLCPRCKVFTCP